MRRSCAAGAIVVGVLAWLVAAPLRGIAAPAGSRSGPPAAAAHGGTGGQAAAAPASAPAADPALPGTAFWVVTVGSSAPPSGPLSAAEARQLQRIRQAARKLEASLAQLAEAARQQGDAALQGELARLDALLGQLAAAQQWTLAAYLAALNAAAEARALWAGDVAAPESGDPPAWLQEAETAASDLTTAAETGFVFAADLDRGTAWTYAEGGGAPGDVAGPAAAAGEPGGPDTSGGAGVPGSDAEGEEMPAESAAPQSASLTEPGLAAGAEAGAWAGEAASTGEAVAAMEPGDETAVAGDGEMSGLGEEVAEPADASAPAFSAELGEPWSDDLSAAEPGSPSGGDAAGAGPLLLDGENLCRPWRPSRAAANADSGMCLLPTRATEGLR
jgi:hypothetical protein